MGLNLRKLADPLNIFGDDSSGGDGGEQQRAEEARKAAIRRQIDLLFGIAPDSVAEYTPQPFPEAGPVGTYGEGGYDQPTAEQIADFEERKRAHDAAEAAKVSGVRQEGAAAAAAAAAASQQLQGESTKLAEALRSHYTDELGRDFEEGERRNRFALARRGLLGGSVDVDTGSRLKSDRDLGGTRITEAVRRAQTNLAGQREQERLQSHSLVNAGAGDQAVRAAQSGISQSIENASNAQKESLFGDLFTATADTASLGNEAAREQALLARYRDRLSTFFPSRSSSSGRITASE